MTAVVIRQESPKGRCARAQVSSMSGNVEMFGF